MMGPIQGASGRKLAGIELKSNKTPGRAIAQIKSKEYFHAFDYYHGKILFIGINYDEKKKHQCEIEEVLI